jgi:phage baseplate assembly protein W
MKGIIFENNQYFAQIGEINRLVMESVKRIIMTSPGERPNLLDFGVGAKNFLFSSISYLTEHEIDRMKSVLEYYEPRIIINTLEFKKVEDSKIKCLISYVIKEYYIDVQEFDFIIGN